MEYYVCFYTITPFWAGEAPDIKNLVIAANAVPDSNIFTKALSNVEFKYDNNQVYFAVCKDGLIMTKIKELDCKREEFISRDAKNGYIQFTKEYLKYLNSIQLILSSAVIKNRAFFLLQNFIIRPGEAFNVSIDDKGVGSGVPIGVTSSYFNGRYMCYYRCDFDMGIELDDRISMRRSVQEEVFKTCFEDLNIVINNVEAIQILNQFNSALSEYKSLNLRQSLVQSWCIIEHYINKMFNNYLTNQNTKDQRFIKKRYDDACKKINFLNEKQIIHKDTSKIMHNVRKKRNDDLHNLYSKNQEITIDDCNDAFDLIIDLIYKEYQLDLEISRGISFSIL